MEDYFYSKKLYYRQNEFIPSRQTIVFIHGLSGSSSAWLPYEQYFQARYNILTFDLRGHGRSYKPPHLDDYRMSCFAEDLFELLKFLKIEKFILVSHSFGVLIALEFLSLYPHKVTKTVFLSPNFAPDRIGAAKILKPFLTLVPILKIFPFKSVGRGQVDYTKFKNTGDWNIPRMVKDIGITGWHVYLYGTKQSYDVDYENSLDQIKIPSLIIHGKKDTIFPLQDAMRMHKKIKNSKMLILEEADHIIVLNNFSEVSTAIEEFIS